MKRKAKFRLIALISLLICVVSWFLTQPIMNVLNLVVYVLTSLVVLLMVADQYRRE